MKTINKPEPQTRCKFDLENAPRNKEESIEIEISENLEDPVLMDRNLQQVRS